MPQCCICYTADPAYLFPTFVSAMQARRNASAETADVIIFSIGASAEAERIMTRLCGAENIGFNVVDPARIEGANAMMARLYLDRIAPPDYRQLLYVDGDTQVTGSLDPLLTAPVPSGHFMAARDPIAFSITLDDAGDQAAYLRSVGLSPAQLRHYFNSGVLRINREGWDEIGREASAIFHSLRDRTRYPDQDALNLAGKDRCLPMSLTWNFPIFLRNAGIEDLVQPRIVHYMGRPKPWQGEFLPWGKAGYQPYLQAIGRYPELLSLAEQMPNFRRLKYHGQQHYKRISESMAWRRGFRKRAMLAYENELSSNKAKDVWAALGDAIKRSVR